MRIGRRKEVSNGDIWEWMENCSELAVLSTIVIFMLFWILDEDKIIFIFCYFLWRMLFFNGEIGLFCDDKCKY
jgi:hypothetical protein